MFDGCRQDPVLPRLADTQNLNSLLLQLVPNDFMGFPDIFSPEMVGVTDLCFVIVNPEVYRL